MLGLIDAALGRKEQAVQEGEKAIALLPSSVDAFDGPVLVTNLAALYAAVGDTDRAIAQLESLRNVPNGPSPGTLRVEPEWDSLRQDPRFQQLTS